MDKQTIDTYNREAESITQQATLTSNELILKPVTKKVDEVFGRLFKADRPSVEISEMDALIRKVQNTVDLS